MTKRLDLDDALRSAAGHKRITIQETTPARTGGTRRRTLAVTAALALLAGIALTRPHPTAQPPAPPAISTAASDPHEYTIFDFREDHRAAPAQFIPDQFTFREDHRVTPQPFVPDFWTYREDYRAP